jgi:hypothetical protein
VAASSSAFQPRAQTFLRAQAERFIRGEDLLNVVTGRY